MAEDTHHPYFTKVARDYGDLVALGQAHPKTGLLQALNVPGGLADWVKAHPPEPEADPQ